MPTSIMLAAVHLSPAIGVPLAVAAMVALGWHHHRLGRAAVPAPRRRVRRAAGVAMVAGVLALLVAVSFADPVVDPTLYVASWSAVVVLLLVMVGIAVVDIGVSSWLIRVEHDGEAMRRGAAVLAALEAEAERREAAGEAAMDGEGDHARAASRRDGEPGDGDDHGGDESRGGHGGRPSPTRSTGGEGR